MIQSSVIRDPMPGYLQDGLRRHADARFSFVGERKSWSYADVAERALELARGLRALKLDLTAPLLLIFDNSDEFLFSFLGCQVAGGIPSPFAPPVSAQGVEAHFQQMYRIMRNAGSRYILIESKFKPYVAKPVAQLYPDLTLLSYEEVREAGRATERFSPKVRADNLVLVQYTSGSTSDPRGVRVTHDNLSSALRAIIDGIRLTDEDVNGQWLPMHHDMGLIGMLTGIAAGVDHCIWSPAKFIRNPVRWLQEFAGHGASIYAGPNFSYEILDNQLDPASIEALDLSRWRIAFNGAEPIDAALVDRLTRKLAPAGFAPATMFPVYGLAEATLPVTFPRLGATPAVVRVDHDVLIQQGVVRPLAENQQADGEAAYVAVGEAVPGQQIRIVRDGQDVSEREMLGEIQVRGTAVMDGYFNNEEATRETFDNGWLRTGDTGFIHDGQLHVVGRIKEMIIVRGNNYYPHDFEWLVKDLSGIRHGRVICVSTLRDRTERIEVVAETTLETAAERRALADAIRSRILDGSGIGASEVHLVPPRSIRRTTSGKFKRAEMKALIQSDWLDEHRLSLTEAQPTEAES